MSCVPCGNLEVGKVIGLSAGNALLDFSGRQVQAKLPPNCHPRIGQELAFYMCREQAYAICTEKFKRPVNTPTVEELPIISPTGLPIYPELPGTHKGTMDIAFYPSGAYGQKPYYPYLGTRSRVDPFYYFISQSRVLAGRARKRFGESPPANTRDLALPMSDFLGLVAQPVPYRSDEPLAARAIARDLSPIDGLSLREAFFAKYSSTSSVRQIISTALSWLFSELPVDFLGMPYGFSVISKPNSDFFDTEYYDAITNETQITNDPLIGDQDTLGHELPPTIGIPEASDLIDITTERNTVRVAIETTRHDYQFAVVDQDLIIRSYRDYADKWLASSGSSLPTTAAGYTRVRTFPANVERSLLFLASWTEDSGETYRYFNYEIASRSETEHTIPAYNYTITWQRDEETGLGWLNFTLTIPAGGPFERLYSRPSYTTFRSIKDWQADNPDVYQRTTTTYLELVRVTSLLGFADKDILNTQFEELKNGNSPALVPLSALGGAGPIATEVDLTNPATSRPYWLPPDLRSYQYLVADPDLPDRAGVAKIVTASTATEPDSVTVSYTAKPNFAEVLGQQGTCSLFFDGWIKDTATSKRYVRIWTGAIVTSPAGQLTTVDRGVFRPEYDEPNLLYKGRFGAVTKSSASTLLTDGSDTYKLLDIEIPQSPPHRHGEILLRYRDVVYAAAITIEGPAGALQPYVRMQRKKIGFKPGEERLESAWYPRVKDTWAGPLRRLVQDQFLLWNPQTLWNAVERIEVPESVVRSEEWPHASGQVYFLDSNGIGYATVVFRPTLPFDYPEMHPDFPLVTDDRQAIPPLVPVVVGSTQAQQVPGRNHYWTPEQQ